MIADLATIAGYALREAVRRKALVVVLALTAAFLGLYWLGAREAFDAAAELGGGQDVVRERVVAGAYLLGLGTFVILFLGVVLAVFLTLTAVRGDAERGLLQPLVVRPVGRTTLLAGRFLGAVAVCVTYVLVVYTAIVLITGAVGDFWPSRPVGVGVGLAAAIVVVIAIALLGSTVLSTTANGIAVFMIFGAGLTAGLLGQIGEALESDTLQQISSVASWALPFEALYQDGLSALTGDIGGVTGVIVNLGPFGGAQAASPLLWPYALAYVLVVGLLADRSFRRADL